jgi:hypothetical protein
MDAVFVSALSAVFGSIVGGSASIATAWIGHRTQGKRDLVRGELGKRETLYGEFIGECSKLAIDSLAHGIENPETLWTAYALLNRIRLSASPAVLTEAEKLLSQIAAQYYAPNLSADEFRTLVGSWETDPLKPLGDACRDELAKLRAEG